MQSSRWSRRVRWVDVDFPPLPYLELLGIYWSLFDFLGSRLTGFSISRQQMYANTSKILGSCLCLACSFPMLFMCM